MPLILAGATSGATTIQATDGATQTITLPNNTGTIITTGNIPTGQIIQVVSTTKTDTFSSTTTNAFTDITGLSVSITPTSSSNTILVMVSVQGINAGSNTYFRLVRGFSYWGWHYYWLKVSCIIIKYSYK
jgi:hypothetical protein